MITVNIKAGVIQDCLPYFTVPKQIGDYCKYQGWCHTRLGKDVLCEDNKCLCKDRYLPNPTMTGCVPCKYI